MLVGLDIYVIDVYCPIGDNNRVLCDTIKMQNMSHVTHTTNSSSDKRYTFSDCIY